MGALYRLEALPTHAGTLAWRPTPPALFSRHNPNWSSKARLMSASNCPRKAIALAARRPTNDCCCSPRQSWWGSQEALRNSETLPIVLARCRSTRQPMRQPPPYSAHLHHMVILARDTCRRLQQAAKQKAGPNTKRRKRNRVCKPGGVVNDSATTPSRTMLEINIFRKHQSLQHSVQIYN